MTQPPPKVGLFRKKPTYTEILDLVDEDKAKITLPDRTAVTVCGIALP